MKKTKIFQFVICLTLLCTLFCSCGGRDLAEADVAFPNEKADLDYEYSYGYGNGDSPDISVKDESFSDSSASVPSDYAEKIIRNVSMSAETREFDQAMNEIRAAVLLHNGFEQSVNTTGRSYNSGNTYCRSARMVLRIPAEKLEAFLGDVGDLINVTSQSTNSDNVTTQYYDIQSRIEVLKSEKAAYEEMLKQSDEVEHLLKIKDRLYNVIEEIESYETQLRLYDNKVAYSTVTLNLEEVVEYTPVVTPKDTFSTRVSNAFSESWRDFASGCQNFAVWFVYALPTILVLAVIFGGSFAIVFISIRRSVKRSRKNRQ